MNLTCERCEQPFEHSTFRGYCDDCREHFAGVRESVHAKQLSQPGVIACGQFAEQQDCPRTAWDPVSNLNCCGLCGSPNVEAGYGFGGGYGLGSYQFCFDCNNFLDFSEDTDE